jgi:serine/threonine protein kinase
MAGFPEKFSTAFHVYTRGKQLGQGGAGRVFEVVDEEGKQFALKLLDPGSITTDRLKRFQNEIALSQQNRHPGIIRVLDMGYCELSGRKAPFYLMPLYPYTLRNVIDQGVPSERGLAITIAMLDALAVAHELDVCHRDLKPQNVLFSEPGGSPVIADFGIARFLGDFPATFVATREDTRLANFEYAAPEQRRPGAQVDKRADLYSVALIATELFTGEVPHGLGAKQIASVDSRFAFLDPILEEMRSQDPARRPGSAIQVLRTIKAGQEAAFPAPSREEHPDSDVDANRINLRRQASALKATVSHERVRREMLNSQEGVEAANSSVERILAGITEIADDLKSDLPFKVATSRIQETFELTGAGFAISIDFDRRYANTLDSSELRIIFWGGPAAPIRGRMFFEAPQRLDEVTYVPDFAMDRSIAWRSTRGASTIVAENDIVIYVVSRFLELVEKKQKKT